MKKPKRSEEWEDSPLVSSKDFGAELEDLDEEIIELDDEIIELPAEGLEHDEDSAFDVEILDAERQPETKEGEGKGELDDEFLLDDELLKELPFFQDQSEEEKAEVPAAEELAIPALEEPAEELFSDKMEAIPEEPLSSEPVAEAEAPGPADESPALPIEPIQAIPETDLSLDDFVAGIENRLLDVVREMVEARLPDIVRAVLREEIQLIKGNGESEA